MGQQPNIELEISELPRPTPAPGVPRRWQPNRPGDLSSPEAVPWGGAFGTVGPDTGFALKLITTRDLDLEEGERRDNVERVLVAVAGARASHFGRAPTQEDVEVALVIFGLAPEGLPDQLVEELRADRAAWFGGAGHDVIKARELLGDVPRDVLASSPEELRTRMAAGERLISR